MEERKEEHHRGLLGFAVERFQDTSLAEVLDTRTPGGRQEEEGTPSALHGSPVQLAVPRWGTDAEIGVCACVSSYPDS